ncbi:MAG: hypothetical protein ACK55Z_07690 [bacterium]
MLATAFEVFPSATAIAEMECRSSPLTACNAIFESTMLPGNPRDLRTRS